jgi:hypothetical protein
MKTIKLAHPFKNTSGVLVSEVAMRLPLVRDARIAENSGGTQVEKELRIIGNLCDLAPDDLDRLAMSDYALLQKQYVDFTSPRTEI